MSGTMQKYIAEMIGTAGLVLFGCGSAILGVAGMVDIVGIAAAFGLAVTAMAYFIGPVSGCHINPAVTVGVALAGRMPMSEVPGYVIAQVIGGFVGAGLLALIVAGKGGGYEIASAGLGQNGWGPGYLAEYGMGAALVTELVATFIFVCVILGVTASEKTAAIAGLIIGLTLFMIHITFIPVTGVSVNPARSLAPAVYVGGTAIAQVWLFLIVPLIGGALAGILFKTGLVSPKD